jgi:glycerophosphoryl diester phosphodiesterase
MAIRPLVLAHRGASARAAENTLAAFALAREMGADGVELDVRHTSDRVLVVHHDPSIDGLGLVADVPFDRLRAARPEIPTFAGALDACAGMLVNVEMKCLPWEPDADDPGDRPLVRAVVDAVRVSSSAVVVSSFDLGAVDAARTFAPELTTGWLTSRLDVAAAYPMAAEHGHRWLHPDRKSALRAPADAIAAAHEAELLLDVWTVDDPADVRALVARGVDAIITNVPDVVLGVL